jgi:predicted RNA-binding protein with PIN domain
MRRLVVDAMNVIGSRPTGWWRDRDGAVRRLLASLQRLVRETGDEIVIVVDGRPMEGLPESVHDGVQVLYASGGRNAADHRIAELVEADEEPSKIIVVTSDRELASRVRAAGASVLGASWLLDQLDRLR